MQWIFDSKSAVTAFLVRDQLENGVSFEEAIGIFATTPLIAPVYCMEAEVVLMIEMIFFLQFRRYY